jgi:hypothetical protein
MGGYGNPDLPKKMPPEGPVSYLLSMKLAAICGDYDEEEQVGD